MERKGWQNIDLNKQAQDILKAAESLDAEQGFFFITTFKRYTVQLDILTGLEKKIKKSGNNKQYISEYNRTANAANQTAQTLIKIITQEGMTKQTDIQSGASLLERLLDG